MIVTKTSKVPAAELNSRLKRFSAEMGRAYPDWGLCAITGGISMYYLTGVICDGVLIIKRGENAVLWVRRSYERAVLESEFSDIRPMRSFRDVAADLGTTADTLYLDMSAASMEWYGMLTKYIPFKAVLPNDKVMMKVRSVKTTYELDILRRAGETIDRLLREELPPYLRNGITEAELAAELLPLFVRNGYHGVSRFSTRYPEMVLGHICFASSPLYPSVFNGASGIAGLCPAAPVLGSTVNCLREGDLVYVDIGFGVEGYHADKTLVYSYKREQPESVINAHLHCMELEEMAASMLRPGAIPSEIYDAVLRCVKPELSDSFMGAPGRTVPFLGHSVGLYIDETPVLARGFDEPLEENMVIAIEPKIGIEDIGMVGGENTYLVTKTGGISLTGKRMDIIPCE